MWQHVKAAAIKGLYERGLTANQVRQLFRLIDWMVQLPAELQQQFREEIHRFEEERHMPYVTSIERSAMREGQRKGLLECIAATLEEKFGAAGGNVGLAVHPKTTLTGTPRGLMSAVSTPLVREGCV